MRRRLEEFFLKIPIRYEAWETEDGTTFFRSAQLALLKQNPAIHLKKKLFEFNAATAEEAASINSLRMGRGPYIPVGDPRPCPKCGAWFYPEGSGECWRCGP
jgi:hypothetical protein